MMNSHRITMIDYGGSNLRSVQKAFEAVGAVVEVASAPGDLRGRQRLVLPGVGAFGAGMDALRARGLNEAMIDAIDRGALLLGICLGMQLLFEESEEIGHHAGLGLMSGRVVRFDGRPQPASTRGLKVPHMGWNQINHNGTHPLLKGVSSGAHAYFVHSYYCQPEDPATVLASTDYGVSFAAIVGRGRIFGIQFHPEKSQSTGLRILQNFAEMGVGPNDI